jgi:hypothetical protein
MARKRQQQQQQLGRPTTFLRKLGDGEFQEVPVGKLAGYEKRFAVRRASSSSTSHSSGQC